MDVDNIMFYAVAITTALASALGYVYREFLTYRKAAEKEAAAVREELKEDRNTILTKFVECEESHNVTRMELAELRGRVDTGNQVADLVNNALAALGPK